MSLVVTSKSFEIIEQNYLLLLDNLTDVIKKEIPYFDPSPTKLGHIKRNLQKFKSLDLKQQLHTLELANKFSCIWPVLSIANVDIGDLHKAVKGKFQPDEDSSQEYNGFFFEIAMASRYLQIFPENSPVTIELNGITDLVIDSHFAIECKYLISSNKVSKNIKKAAAQINERVNSGLARHGIIALDFTHLFDYKENDRRFGNLLKRYYDEHRKNDYATKDSFIYNRIVNDKEFINKASRIGITLIEEILSPCLKGLSLSENIIGIHYEYSNTFVIDCDEIIVVPVRGLSYFPNPKLDDEGKKLFGKFTHKLAVGI
ncbi:hypothetical protein ACSLBF_07545 [Pseudoalteromonas sp. T1lg65]|uniref:hypothetical protein n=1 Tax=Pseudoalteromonas sp. T1lg65 TaxID=2077101 RepID=UPI003F7A7DE6